MMTLSSSTHTSHPSKEIPLESHAGVRKLRVLLVDDSPVYRKILSNVLTHLPYTEEVGQCSQGEEALKWLKQHQADLVLLDVQMPVLDGLSTLKVIQKTVKPLPPKVIMVSGTGREYAGITIQALEVGAYDFVKKPQSDSPQTSKEKLLKHLAPLVESLAMQEGILRKPQAPLSSSEVETLSVESLPTEVSLTPLRHRPSVNAVLARQYKPSHADTSSDTPTHKPNTESVIPSAIKPSTQETHQKQERSERSGTEQLKVLHQNKSQERPTQKKPLASVTSSSTTLNTARVTTQPITHKVDNLPKGAGTYSGIIDVVCIGVSTGGPQALREVIPRLDPDLPVPVLLVQHMPPSFTASLAESLQERSRIKVKEGEHNEVISPGVVYIAPGGLHMTVLGTRKQKAYRIKLTETPPVHNCRPSVDVLFQSVAEMYGNNILSVVMTGMGSDGATGTATIKTTASVSSYCLAQSFDTCVVSSMPQSAARTVTLDGVVPLAEIADVINRTCLPSQSQRTLALNASSL